MEISTFFKIKHIKKKANFYSTLMMCLIC